MYQHLDAATGISGELVLESAANTERATFRLMRPGLFRFETKDGQWIFDGERGWKAEPHQYQRLSAAAAQQRVAFLFGMESFLDPKRKLQATGEPVTGLFDGSLATSVPIRLPKAVEGAAEARLYINDRTHFPVGFEIRGQSLHILGTYSKLDLEQGVQRSGFEFRPAAGQVDATPPDPLAKMVPVGGKAPLFKLPRSSNGQPFDLEAATKRSRAVLVTFWRADSGQSRDELEILKSLHETFGSQGLMVVAVNGHEPPQAVTSIARGLNLEFACLSDPERKTSTAYGVTLFPSTVLINAAGQVVARFGAMEENPLADALEKLGFKL
jgi:peroxiredoxin/outer membrane lipoprotein-sorting protein